MQSDIPNPFEAIHTQLNRMEALLVELKLQQEKKINPISKAHESGIDLAIRITGLKKKTIYNLVCMRKIPHAKKGNRLYFNEEDLRMWITEGKRFSLDELKTSHQ